MNPQPGPQRGEPTAMAETEESVGGNKRAGDGRSVRKALPRPDQAGDGRSERPRWVLMRMFWWATIARLGTAGRETLPSPDTRPDLRCYRASRSLAAIDALVEASGE